MFMQAAHTAAPLDMGDVNNEQDEDPGDINGEQADESYRTQPEDHEEYIKLEMYKNNYYTHDSESEGLFTLTKVPASPSLKCLPPSIEHKSWLKGQSQVDLA
ncbi:hypothetical protein C0989_007074 [Termitomyces sp. Mn162]|nr:hypothetical protein C0989_007074 [Termitomyces sp. Mn162]